MSVRTDQRVGRNSEAYSADYGDGSAQYAALLRPTKSPCFANQYPHDPQRGRTAT
jgi:hypothetical protein